MTNNGWIAGANAPAGRMYNPQTMISNTRFIATLVTHRAAVPDRRAMRQRDDAAARYW